MPGLAALYLHLPTGSEVTDTTTKPMDETTTYHMPYPMITSMTNLMADPIIGPMTDPNTDLMTNLMTNLMTESTTAPFADP